MSLGAEANVLRNIKSFDSRDVLALDEQTGSGKYRFFVSVKTRRIASQESCAATVTPPSLADR